jgi:capsular polysaccharide biosynthesis protein/MinD-like ATPase involved in chromosome partitioning or flagellar assembly
MNPPAASQYLELSEYLDVLRRRWRVVVLLTCIGIVLAAGYVKLAPAQYTGSALVQVNALPSNANAVGGRTAGPVNMDNEAQVVKSTAVAQIVKSAMHSSLSVTDLDKNITVSVPANTTFLQISYKASSASAARKWTNEVARAYLGERRTSTQTLIGSGVTALRAQATRLRSTIERLKALLRSTRPAGGHGALVGDQLQLANAQIALASVQAHIDDAMPLYDSLTAPHSVIVGTIVSPAILPPFPSSPRKLLVLPSGLMAGLILGLALAFVRDARDKRIHSARDAERVTTLPTLLSLSGADGRLTTIEQPRSRAGQSFGELARYISGTLGGGSHVLAVATTSPGPSGSLVAANLAAALARTGDETVVICADEDQTSVPELFGIGIRRGLSDVLAGTATMSDVMNKAHGWPRLRLIGPGAELPGIDAASRYGRAQVLTDLLNEARFVIIEFHASADLAGTISFAEFAETALIVVEAERSRPADIADCLQRLDRLQTPALGTIVVPAVTTGRARRAGRAERSAQASLADAGGATAQWTEDDVALSDPPVASQPRFDRIEPAERAGRGDRKKASGSAPAPSSAATREPDHDADGRGPLSAAGLARWTTPARSAAGERPDLAGASVTRRINDDWPAPDAAGDDNADTESSDRAAGR